MSSKDRLQSFLDFFLILQPDFSICFPLQKHVVDILERELKINCDRLAKMWKKHSRSRVNVLKDPFFLIPDPINFLRKNVARTGPPKKSYQDCCPRIRRVKARKSTESIARLEILDQAVQVLKDEGLASEAKQLKSWLKRLINSKSSSLVSTSSVLSSGSAVAVMIDSNLSVNHYR